jgi:RNA polymerase sigma factor (sigma-70 family)
MEHDLDDHALLEAWRSQGEPQAYHRLVVRHAGRVESICRRITGDTQLAQDAAQAVFLVLADKGRRLPSDTVLVAWLHVTARHIALRARQETQRRHQREAVAGRRMDDMATTSADPRLVELGPEMDEALAALGREEREAILLRHVSGFDWEALAAALGVARNTAEKRVSRGLERLRALLARRGFVVASTAIAAALAQDAAAGEPAWAAGWTPVQAQGSSAAVLAQAGKPIWLTATVAAALTLGVTVAALVLLPPGGAPPVPPAADPPVTEPPPAADPPHILVRAGHTGHASQLRIAASADGRYLATSDEGQRELRIWDGRDPQRLVLSMSTSVSAVAFAPDGGSFAVMGGKDITRWSLPAGRPLGTISSPGVISYNAELHFLDAGHLLANGSDKGGFGAIHALDGTPAVKLAPLTVEESRRRDELEQQLAAQNQPGVQHRAPGDSRDSLLSRRELQEELDELVGGHFSRVLVRPVLQGQAVAVLRDRHLLADTPTICDAATGAFLRRCEERHPLTASQKRQVQSRLLTSPDGAVVGLNRFQGLGQQTHWQITLWDPATGTELAHREGTTSGNDRVLRALLLSDRKILLLRWQANQLWRWHDQADPEPGPAGEQFHLASPDGSRLAVVQEKQLRLLDVATGRLDDWDIIDPEDQAAAASVAVSPGGRLAATAPEINGRAGTMHVWDLAAVQLVNSAPLPPEQDDGSAWVHLGFAADARRLFVVTAVQHRNPPPRDAVTLPPDITTIALHTWDLAGPLPEPWWLGSMTDCDFFASGIALAGDAAWIINGEAVQHVDMSGMRVLESVSLRATASPLRRSSWSLRGVDVDTGAIFAWPEWPGSGPGVRLDPRQGETSPITADIVACASTRGWRVVQPPDDAQRNQQAPRLLGPPGRPEVELPLGFSWQFDATGGWFAGITEHDVVVGEVPPADAPATAQPGIRYRLPLRLVSSTRGWNRHSRRDGTSHFDLRLLPGGKGLLCGSYDGLVLVDVASGTEVLRLRAWPDGSWLAMAPDGVHDGSDAGVRRLSLSNAAGHALTEDERQRLRKPDELRRRTAGYVLHAQEGGVGHDGGHAPAKVPERSGF